MVLPTVGNRKGATIILICQDEGKKLALVVLPTASNRKACHNHIDLAGQ